MPKREEITEDTQKKTTTTMPVEEKVEETKTVQKSVLEERVKKFLKEIDPELLNKINELTDRQVVDKQNNNEKVNIVFMVFSTNGEQDGDKPDNAVNEECMKKILFHYHTATDKTSGKSLLIEILASKSDDQPHVMCFQEM